MTSTSRTITSGVLEWRGMILQITFERQRFVDWLEIETLEPTRAPLPITETGYRSHFISKNIIKQAGGPETYVEAWLNEAAKLRGWIEIESDIRQYALL